MKTKSKTVYYCDFCKKYKLTKSSMQLHERHCTLNPHRKCRVCNDKDVMRIQDVANLLRDEYEKVKKKIEVSTECGFRTLKVDGVVAGEFRSAVERILEKMDCPACSLASLRQAGSMDWECVEYYYDYKEEMRKYWDEMSQDAESDYC